MYEAQIGQLQQQTFNMEQASLTTENLRNTMATVDAMKTANKELRKQYGKLDVDKIEQMPTVADPSGARISSSAVRASLVAGDLDAARAALGRPYAISGHVVHGLKLGRDLGFPTLNLPIAHKRPALSGIFIVRVHGIGEAPLPGVASLGLRPTVDDSGRVLLEVHLLDWHGDAYGKLVRVEFLKKLRDEQKKLIGDLNPGLRVPTLVLDDGRPLAESNAILWYFADGTPYLSDDPYERAQTLQWMFFEQYSHEPYIAVARFLKTYSGRPEQFDKQRERLLVGGYAALAAMETAWDTESGFMGSGGSIPLVARLQGISPDAEVILWGAEDVAEAKIHASNESVDLSEIEKMIVAQALTLQTLGQGA